jgi:hypothetical protein
MEYSHVQKQKKGIRHTIKETEKWNEETSPAAVLKKTCFQRRVYNGWSASLTVRERVRAFKKTWTYER